MTAPSKPQRGKLKRVRFDPRWTYERDSHYLIIVRENGRLKLYTGGGRSRFISSHSTWDEVYLAIDAWIAPRERKRAAANARYAREQKQEAELRKLRALCAKPVQ